MALARTSSGKHSPTVRYAELAAAEAKKNTKLHASVWVCGVNRSALKKSPVTMISAPESA